MDSKHQGGRAGFLKIGGIIAILCLVVFMLVSLLPAVLAQLKPAFYETTNIADYGNYPGNYAEEFPKKYIMSFFPDHIDESFQDISYSYRAKKFDTYSFEAYLEFTISDTAEFQRYVSEIAPEELWHVFSFNSEYMEYSIENVLYLGKSQNDGYYPIEQAKISKILYSAKSQTVIFLALGVYDGGGVGTDYLNVFFERFDIDPYAYAQTVDSKGADPYEIPAVTEGCLRN